MENGESIAGKAKETKPVDQSKRKFIKTASVLLLTAAVGGLTFDKSSQKAREISNIRNDSQLARIIEGMKKEFAGIDQWSNNEEWATDIKNAFKKNDLDTKDENIGIVLTLLNSSSGLRSVPRSIDFLPSPPESVFHKLGIKSPKTSGPLETNIQFVMDTKNIGYDEALALLSQRPEGLDLGIAFLKLHINEYADISNPEKRLACIFADYNSKLFASRNAGLQASVNKLTDKHLDTDGVFGAETINAISDHFLKKDVKISRQDIENDLLHSSRNDMLQSPTYKLLCTLQNVDHLEAEVAETPVQGTIGFLKEHLTGVKTSKDYANKRLEEYKKIMAIIKSTPFTHP